MLVVCLEPAFRVDQVRGKEGVDECGFTESCLA